MKTYQSIASVLLATLAFTGCNKPQSGGSSTELASPVTVMELSTASIKKYNTTTGNALSTAQTELKSEIAGNYQLQINPKTKQFYKLGDVVKAGDTIVKFEDQEYLNGIAIDSKKLSLEIAVNDYKKQKSLYDLGGVTLTDLKNAEVRITTTRYDYENAEIRLNKMAIKAPITGIIVDLPYYTNNVKMEAGKAIATLMDYSKMYMEINLPESALTQVKVGQSVAITHYTLPEDTIKGVVTQLSPAISSETRTFKGVVTIDNPKLQIRPGMFVKADIVVDQANGTIVIPKEVVMNNRNRRYVWVVEKNAAKMRNLKVGLEDKDNIEVLEGLKIGDNLVIRGFETLREDSKVKIQK